MAFINRTARNQLLEDIVIEEANVRVGTDLQDFSRRCERRARKELRLRGISVIIVWWIVKFVLWSIIQEFFFSAKADELRSKQA